jgi:sugar phosphate isomerase/epimerase
MKEGSMKLGAYTACLHDKTLGEALDILCDLGLTSEEVNSGGFIPSPHLPVDALLASASARSAYLKLYADRGLELTGLNCNGNPLNPLPGVGPKHADDLRKSIRLAGLLGVKRVVTMSGVPGSDSDARYPSWVVNPWDGVYMDVLEYQWDLAVPFWKEIDAWPAWPVSRWRSSCTRTTSSSTPSRSSDSSSARARPTSAPSWTRAT